MTDRLGRQLYYQFAKDENGSYTTYVDYSGTPVLSGTEGASTVEALKNVTSLVRGQLVNNGYYSLGGGGGTGSSGLGTLSGAGLSLADKISNIKKAGINTDNMSADQIVSLAEKFGTDSLSPIGAGINYFLKSDKLNLAAVISASKTDSRAKYIASPIVMTVDNKEATIDATENRQFLTGWSAQSGSYGNSGQPTPNYSAKDIGIKIHLCKVRTPETKGKVESANRFVQWIEPYNGELESEDELIGLISKIEHDVNNEINRTTGIPPVKLIKKEMEHLKPLPNKLLMEEFIRNVSVQTVPQTLLVSHKGSGYSVPAKFIGKRVKIVPSGDKLYIYHNTELIAIHEISGKKMNYHEGHYASGLRQNMPANISDDEIHERAKENLAILDQWEGSE
jgi:hypothetical protein